MFKTVFYFVYDLLYPIITLFVTQPDVVSEQPGYGTGSDEIDDGGIYE